MILVWVLLLSIAGAQAKPDFSGVWTMDMSLLKTTIKVDPKMKQTALPPMPVTIRQSAETIDIENAPPFPDFKPVRHIYSLAGKESVNRNGANTQTTRSRWEGSKLITEGTSFSETSQGEFLWKMIETRWLDEKGRMIVETRTTDEAGTLNVVTKTFDKKK